MGDGLKATRLTKKDPLSWRLMPQLTERIFHWGVEFNQADIQQVIGRLEAIFMLDERAEPAYRDSMACWMILDEHEQIRCHLLAEETVWGGRRVGYVNQVALKPGPCPLPLRQVCLQEMEAWMRARGLTEWLGSTAIFHLRAWHRLFGAELYRMILRKSLEVPCQPEA